MFPNFCLLFTNSFTESIEDDMINMYFEDIDYIENSYQEKLKDLRFKIFQAQSSGNKKVAENFKTQFDTLEKEFHIYVAVTMNQKRKEAIYNKVCNTLPILTFGNPYFKEYLHTRESEDQSLIKFMTK
jgi:hypothetical protein